MKSAANAREKLSKLCYGRRAWSHTEIHTLFTGKYTKSIAPGAPSRTEGARIANCNWVRQTTAPPTDPRKFITDDSKAPIAFAPSTIMVRLLCQQSISTILPDRSPISHAPHTLPRTQQTTKIYIYIWCENCVELTPLRSSFCWCTAMPCRPHLGRSYGNGKTPEPSVNVGMCEKVQTAFNTIKLNSQLFRIVRARILWCWMWQRVTRAGTQASERTSDCAANHSIYLQSTQHKNFNLKKKKRYFSFKYFFLFFFFFLLHFKMRCPHSRARRLHHNIHLVIRWLVRNLSHYSDDDDDGRVNRRTICAGWHIIIKLYFFRLIFFGSKLNAREHHEHKLRIRILKDAKCREIFR